MSNKTAKAIENFHKYLTPKDINKLLNALNVPSGICEKTKNPLVFLRALELWPNFSPTKFITALRQIRPTLVQYVDYLPCISAARERKKRISTPMEQFVKILSSELPFSDWRKILYSQGNYLEDGSDQLKIFRACLETKIITNDLSVLSGLLKDIERNEVANSLDFFNEQFKQMQPTQFDEEFKKVALKNESAEIGKWQIELFQYTRTIFETIEAILGSSVRVDLEEIYTPLTVIRYNTSAQKRGESGQTEIDMLREMFRKNVKNKDILKLLSACKPDKMKSWCLIGNPGCGKTWMCNRVALMFGKGDLPQFHFSISIPCRNQEWHSQEETRIQKCQPISSQSLQDWLLLGLPLGTNWSEDLAAHLVKTGGEGLLLVIDSIDEFAKSVPIDKTILASLLTRRTLYKCTLLVTSRPAAWSQVSSSLPDIKMNSYHQVLGFSSENRDLYVSKRLEIRQHKLFHHMLSLHDEIALLCLIPVNASLFTALFQLSDAVAASTLTQLYSQLFLYLIRRQLSRMKLAAYTKVEQLFQLNEGVLKCLNSIGEVAYKGVSDRELTSTARFRLHIVGEKEQDSECLGLVQVQVKETTPGVKTVVWCFSHLTLQEFTASLYLSSIHWRHLCVLTRYMVSTRDVFNVYRMILRFCCGLLTDNASSIVPIVFRHQLTSPVPNIDMSPLSFKPNDEKSFSSFTGWNEFSSDFPPLITLVAESELTPLYSYINTSLQDSLYFYFKSSIPLNDWNNFVASLPFIQKSIKVIWIDLHYITTEQLQTLLLRLPSSSVQYLALYCFGGEITKLESICHLLAGSPPLSAKISFEINNEISPILGLYSSPNQIVSSIGLSEISISVLWRFINRNSSLQCLDFNPYCQLRDWEMLLPALRSAEQLEVFRFRYSVFQNFHLKQELISSISKLTSLRELSCSGYTTLDRSEISQLLHLSQLTYLKITSSDTETVLQLLKQNKCTLKGLVLNAKNPTALFDILHTCTSLLQLELCHGSFGPRPTSHPLPLPQCIVYVDIAGLRLEPSGLLELCNRIAYHTSIRMLHIRHFDLSLVTCKYLCNLIPTLPQLRKLNLGYSTMHGSKNTDSEQLIRTASQYSVGLERDKTFK